MIKAVFIIKDAFPNERMYDKFNDKLYKVLDRYYQSDYISDYKLDDKRYIEYDIKFEDIDVYDINTVLHNILDELDYKMILEIRLIDKSLVSSVDLT